MLRTTPSFHKPAAVTIGSSASPMVYFSLEAAIKIKELVRQESREIGFLGTVKELGNFEYLIENIYAPKQKVSSGTCELDQQGMIDYQNILFALDDIDGDNRADRINFWGHSHHTMGTAPSGQDESQFKDIYQHKDSPLDFFIRGIFNKKGEARIDICYPNIMGLQFDHVGCGVLYEDNILQQISDEAKTEIKENVGSISYSPSANYYGGNYSRGTYSPSTGTTTPSKKEEELVASFLEDFEVDELGNFTSKSEKGRLSRRQIAKLLRNARNRGGKTYNDAKRENSQKEEATEGVNAD